jgi:hypothetical protein
MSALRAALKGRVRWGLELFIAAIVVLALIQLHKDIIRTALYQVGLGIDGATLLAARDGCDNMRLLPPALSDLMKVPADAARPECAQQQDLWVTRPQGDDAILFLNGAFARADSGANRLSVFPAIRLREGDNHLAVYTSDTKLLYPYAWKDKSDGLALLAVGDDFATELTQRANSMRMQVPTDTATDVAVADPVNRTLSLTRTPDGTVQVSASACLSPGDPMLGWARNAALQGPEFVARVFMTFIMGPPVEASAPRWRESHPVRLNSALPDQGCRQATTSYAVSQGTVMSAGSFVSGPGDRLVVGGFSGKLMTLGRGPDAVNDDQFVWKGSADALGNDSVMILTIPEVARQRVQLPEVNQEARQHSNLFAALRNLEDLLPQLLRALFWGLAAAAPVGLIFWAIKKYSPTNAEAKERIRNARQGVLALLVFMLAFALQPLLLAGTRMLLGILPSLPTTALVRTSIDFYVPLSVLAAFLVVSVLRASRSDERISTYRLRRIFAALTSLVLVVAGFVALTSAHLVTMPSVGSELLGSIHEGWEGLDLSTFGVPKIAIIGGIIGAWLLLCLVVFWIPVYWLFRIAVPRGAVVSSTLGSALIVLLLPLVAALGDLSSLMLVFSQGLSSIGTSAMLMTSSLSQLPKMPSILAVVVVVAVVLRAFREITADMLSKIQQEQFRIYTRTPYLLILTLLIVWPLIGAMAGETGVISTATVRLMSVFQAYGVLLALLGPLAVAHEFDRTSAKRSMEDKFELPEGILLVAAAAFAGYLTLWSRDPISVAIVIIAGWFVFRRLVLGSYIPLGGTNSPQDLVKRFASFLSESHMLSARQTALEKKFAAGDLAKDVLVVEREQIESEKRLLQNTLGLAPDEARRHLFRYGPGSSPLRNGIIGAVAGLIVAGALQLLLPFDLAVIHDASQSGWLALLEKILVDPQYRVVEKAVKGSHVLVLLNEVLNATAIWVVTGFLFGYVFHVVRGRDGFVKAVFFGTGIVIPYMLNQVLTAGGESLSIASLTRVVPLLLFLLVLGVVIFDGAVLRKQGVELSKLPTFYGLSTSISYLSFASGLAAIQPLLQLVGWLTRG